MTWKEMYEQMDNAQKETDVTIFDCKTDEFYPVNLVGFSSEEDAADGILDENHPYLILNR